MGFVQRGLNAGSANKESVSNRQVNATIFYARKNSTNFFQTDAFEHHKSKSAIRTSQKEQNTVRVFLLSDVKIKHVMCEHLTFFCLPTYF